MLSHVISCLTVKDTEAQRNPVSNPSRSSLNSAESISPGTLCYSEELWVLSEQR